MSEQIEAPLIEHLSEVRKRLISCLVGFSAFFIVAYSQSEFLIHWILVPIKRIKPDIKLVTLDVTEGFVTTFKLSAYVALALSMPIMIFQAWRFAEPGLLPKEKFWCRILLIPALILFTFGCCFCYFAVLPAALNFLLNSLGNDFIPAFSYSAYVDFALIFMAAMGVVFELPLLMVFLDQLRLISTEAVQAHRRHGIVAAFILGAVFSPPDVISQIFVSIPLVILMEIGIWFSLMLRKLKGVVPHSTHPE